MWHSISRKTNERQNAFFCVTYSWCCQNLHVVVFYFPFQFVCFWLFLCVPEICGQGKHFWLGQKCKMKSFFFGLNKLLSFKLFCHWWSSFSFSYDSLDQQVLLSLSLPMPKTAFCWFCVLQKCSGWTKNIGWARTSKCSHFLFALNQLFLLKCHWSLWFLINVTLWVIFMVLTTCFDKQAVQCKHAFQTSDHGQSSRPSLQQWSLECLLPPSKKLGQGWHLHWHPFCVKRMRKNQTNCWHLHSFFLGSVPARVKKCCNLGHWTADVLPMLPVSFFFFVCLFACLLVCLFGLDGQVHLVTCCRGLVIVGAGQTGLMFRWRAMKHLCSFFFSWRSSSSAVGGSKMPRNWLSGGKLCCRWFLSSRCRSPSTGRIRWTIVSLFMTFQCLFSKRWEFSFPMWSLVGFQRWGQLKWHALCTAVFWHCWWLRQWDMFTCGNDVSLRVRLVLVSHMKCWIDRLPSCSMGSEATRSSRQTASKVLSHVSQILSLMTACCLFFHCRILSGMNSY